MAQQQEQTIVIVGQYTYKQELSGGQEETGNVTVQKKGEIYIVHWIRDDGPEYRGVGIRTGNTLSVCYSYSTFFIGERGIAVFKITSGPNLVGQWTKLGGDGKIHPDVWTRR